MFALIIIGLLAIYSATHSHPDVSGNFIKQLIFAVVGLIVIFIIYFIPPKYLPLVSYFFYGLTIAALVLVLVIGKKISGSQSWFSIGGFGIQPSEFAKVATVMALANFLTGKFVESDITKPKDFIIAVVMVMLPVGLIMLQPDMGTSLVFLSMIIPILYWAGMPSWVLVLTIAPVLAAIASFLGFIYFIVILILLLAGLVYLRKNIIISAVIIVATVLAGFSTNIIYSKLQPYQQKRIMSVFTPEEDALGAGWNVIQSKVAIGSGGLWGKGFLQGTQTQLKFIPEQWTDFIFCMVGEEFGFIGSIFVVILFMVLIWQIIHTAWLSRNKYMSLLCIGFASILLFHIFINLGMTMGVMPVIGIPLPFMSYGVSFLLSNMIMIGLIMNAYRNRKEYV